MLLVIEIAVIMTWTWQ